MNIALPVQLMTARIPRRYDVLWLSLSVCYYKVPSVLPSGFAVEYQPCIEICCGSE